MNEKTAKARSIRSKATSALELERQVERGSLFTHTAMGRTFLQLQEVESLVYGLTEVLLEKGHVSEAEVHDATVRVRDEIAARGEGLGPAVALRTDPEGAAEAPATAVDCAARMHVCRAVCCRLDFALTAEEVESGKVKWDLGRPYFIRHESSGFCSHNDRTTGFCGIYEDRPVVCRGYSCANDGRIWKDFEAMELNLEWLTENLGESNPRILHALMRDAEASVATDGEVRGDD